VNGNYLPAPQVQTVGSGVNTVASVFRCPSGLEQVADQFSTANGDTATLKDRKDATGAMAWRCVSKGTGVIVDTWYGINATLSNFSTDFEPCRRLPDRSATGAAAWKLTTMTDIQDPSHLVFLFDGIFYDLHFDGNRVNARHGSATRTPKTNILFFDSHCETFNTADLPGGLGPCASGTDIFITAASLANNTTKWRTNQ